VRHLIVLRFLGLTTALQACSESIGPGVGELTLSPCVIAEGASSCEATITWSTISAEAPRVEVDGVTVSEVAIGSVNVVMDTTRHSVVLFDGTARLDEGTVRGLCVSASAWTLDRCRAFALRLDTRAPTSFVEQGRPVSLEVILFQPLGAGPFPVVMFHHGSTGDGSDPSLFTLTYTNEAVARFFTERGWLVVFAQRRGRGRSDGLYDEGFDASRSAYTCDQVPSLAGLDRALQDADAAVAYVTGRADTDATRVLSAGTSRGGVLALAHAGLRPGQFRGALNFVGGWLGEGCGSAATVNRLAFLRGAAFNRATLWLYGENDSFYTLPHSRGNFNAFTGAGGRGTFLTYLRAPTLNGHFIANDPALWGADVDAFLQALMGAVGG
jgi:dienelactone hydrolase